MATETLRPNGNDTTGLYNNTSNQVNNYSYVDESSANDNDFVHNLTVFDGYATDLYAFPATAIPAGSTINKITFYARFKHGEGSDYCKFAYKSGGTTYYSSAPNITTSYAEYSWEQTTNQKTSAAFTIDDINALVAGPSLYYTKSAAGGFCSQFWLVIEYTASGWSNIAKYNGVDSADIAKINGVAVADIAKINGVAI